MTTNTTRAGRPKATAAQEKTRRAAASSTRKAQARLRALDDGTALLAAYKPGALMLARLDADGEVTASTTQRLARRTGRRFVLGFDEDWTSLLMWRSSTFAVEYATLDAAREAAAFLLPLGAPVSAIYEQMVKPAGRIEGLGNSVSVEGVATHPVTA